MSDDAARYRAAITAAFPDLPILTFHFLAEGWDSAVWQANDHRIFRFPKRAEVAGWLRTEIALLPALAPTLPVAVPQFAYVAEPSPTFPFPFVGYEKLPGVQLASAPTGTVESARITAQVGAFLTALHHFPVAQAVACGPPDATPETWRAGYAAMRAALRTLGSRLTAAGRARMETLFARYLDTPAHFAFTPVLLHHDLSGEHLLLDTETGDLTAVIDWSDATMGDPAQDFCGLPAAWLPTLLAHYGGVVDATFTARVAFYRVLGPYHTLLFGLRAGGEPFIERGLAKLREAMGNE